MPSTSSDMEIAVAAQQRLIMPGECVNGSGLRRRSV